MSKENIIVYDIEVFKYDSLVVFKDLDNNEIAHFWSDPKGELSEGSSNGFDKIRRLIDGKTLAGYNNYNYDDLILHKMMMGRPQKEIKALNDRIIRGDDVSAERKEAHRRFESIDCMQQIDVSRPSLKKIEGNMGRSILESDVPFDIDRPLTLEEKEIVLNYCRYDVESTIEVYKLREADYFETKDELIELEGSGRCKRWNTTTIAGNILLDRPETPWDSIRIPEHIWRKVQGIPESVWEMWANTSYVKRKDNNKSVTIREFGCDITFGFGGLHGANCKRSRFKDVMLLDVSSMYPSIIVLLNALGNGTKKYEAIRQERLAIKHTDPVKSQALKLILNSVYGNLKNQYSILHNPMAAVTVCVYGQISLFDLCRRLHEAGYTIVNINTDGVAFVDHSNAGDEYKRVWKIWEQDFGLSLELDKFDLWIQKDVNNYVAKAGDSIKTKGGECNKYAYANFFSNNDARIIQMALVDKLLFDKDPLMTIISHLNEPELFQYVLKAGSTYKGVYDSEGNRMNNVNRIFAALSDDNSTKLYKIRHDGGRVNFPDMPDRMYIYNDDLDKFTDFKDIIDINHYYKIINKKLEGWPLNE